nr:reverse transcriptase domain-containing protein [Tanacetum cinerariifolium]
MSAKRTLWNEFSSSMASAVICLSLGRKFNFSKYIFDSLVDEEGDANENVKEVNGGDAAEGDVSAAHGEVPTVQPPSPQPQPQQAAEFPMNLLQEVIDACAALTKRVEHLEFDKVSQALEITKLKRRVKKLERRNKVRVLKLRRLQKDDVVVLEDDKEEDSEGIDFMGPFPSSRGNKYILVVVDYLSKWVEAKALPTNDARVVCKFLKNLFARFGTPRAIINDHKMHFCNEQFTKVMLKFGVTHRLATPYHPQTNGQVEVSNCGLKQILERTVDENCASWSEKLDDALWDFRTAYKTPIGCTPYKLVYGKACHLPIELEHKAYWALKHANFNLQTAGDHRNV